MDRTVVKLNDVTGKPKIRLDTLPHLRIGDPVHLRFRITRENSGRTELLEVDQTFRVVGFSCDASINPPERLLSVESTSKPPVWRSVKKPPRRRLLAPAKSPRTPI